MRILLALALVIGATILRAAGDPPAGSVLAVALAVSVLILGLVCVGHALRAEEVERAAAGGLLRPLFNALPPRGRRAALGLLSVGITALGTAGIIDALG